MSHYRSIIIRFHALVLAALALTAGAHVAFASERSIPIQVPPGRAGMTPHLQLSYSSGGGNGMYGVGWSMNLGSIRRDTRLGLPEYDADPQWDVPDVFVYTMPSGESGTLVEDPNDLGTYYQQNSTSYLKFEYNDVLNFWLVTDSHGTQYWFGKDEAWNYPDSPGGAMYPNSQIDTADGTYAWLVERVESTLGHRILYRYMADGLQRYPDRIYYTESPSAGATRNRIEFDVTTAPRVDIITSYRNGSGDPIPRSSSSTASPCCTTTSWQDGPILYYDYDGTTKNCFSQDFNGDGLDDIYCGTNAVHINQFGASHRCDDMQLVPQGTPWWTWNDDYSDKGLSADAMLYTQNELGSTVVYCTAPSVDFDNPEGGSSRELLHEKRYYSDEARFDPYDYRTAPAESWTRYSYIDGWYSPETRRFGGFRETYSVNSAGHATHTEYHQGDGVADNGVADTWQLAGKPWLRETGTFGQIGVLFLSLRDATITWQTHDRYGGGVYRASANAVTVAHQQGTIRESLGSVNTMIRDRWMTYDAYFNVTEIDDQGDSTTTDDDLITAIDYTVNTTEHILRTPSTIRAYNDRVPGGGNYANPLKLTQLLYDGHSNPATPPDHGLVTERGVLLDTSGELIRTQYEYGGLDQALSRVSRELELDVFHDIAVSWDASTTYINGWSADVAGGKAAPITLQYSRTINTALGVMLEEKLPNDRMFYYGHDGLGRQTRVLSSAADNATITETLQEIDYDFLGYDSSADVANAVFIRSYFDTGRAVDQLLYFDGFGRTRQVRSSTEAPETARVAEVEYQWGRPIKRSNPFFGNGLAFEAPDLTAHPYTETQYDEVGRTTHLIQPDGAQWRRYYDYLNVESVDPVGDWARHERDVQGRTVLARQSDGNFTESTQQYGYDRLGRLFDTVDSDGNHTLIDYDSLDRRLLLDDPAAGLVEHVWGYQGIEQVIKESGANITYEYDELGRTIEKRQGNPDPAHVNFTKFLYDGNGTGGDVGQLTFTESFDGLQPSAVVTDLYYYDLWGRATDMDRHQRGVNGGNAHTLAAQYNMASQITRLEYPNSQGAVRYGYNDANQLEEVYEEGTAFTYARASDPWQQYNEAGQLNELLYQNGVTTNWTYDPDTLRTDRIVSVKGAGAFQDLQYSYNADGNVSGITDGVHTGGDWRSMTQDFAYDGLDRLTQASGSYGAIDYDYDKIGNLTTVGPTGPYDETYTYAPDKPHAPTRLDSNLYASPTTWSYDADGNVDTKQRGTDTWDYEFTDDGRLHHVKGPSNRVYAFRYDHSGQRILKKKIGGESGTPLYTAYVGKLYEQRVAAGTTTHVKHVFGFGKLLATVRNNDPLSTEFIHQDLRGTPNEVTDINGLATDARRVRHTPFGRETNPAIDPQQTIRFTGQEHDGESEIGLEYFNARYFDVDSRHFVSPDPLVSRPGDTQGWNRFAYVRNNPMTWIDPTGLDPTHIDFEEETEVTGDAPEDDGEEDEDPNIVNVGDDPDHQAPSAEEIADGFLQIKAVSEAMAASAMDNLAVFDLEPMPIENGDDDGIADGIQITYSGYPITTPAGELPLGHAAVVAVDPETGTTRYYEYGRYDGDFGKVKRRTIPDVIIGLDGVPTPESLEVRYDFLSAELGKGRPVIAKYYSDSDYDKIIEFAEQRKNDPNRCPYSLNPLSANTCFTFSWEAIYAGL